MPECLETFLLVDYTICIASQYNTSTVFKTDKTLGLNDDPVYILIPSIHKCSLSTY